MKIPDVWVVVAMANDYPRTVYGPFADRERADEIAEKLRKVEKVSACDNRDLFIRGYVYELEDAP